MEVEILGAHHSESATTRLVSILIDDVLAIDAGGLTSGLSLTQQGDVKSILLTHHHYDHIRDIPAIALNNYLRTIKVYGTALTLNILSSYLLDGTIYPKFTEKPSPQRPALKLFTLEPYKVETIDGYSVLPLPVSHSVPTVGYQITSAEGRSLFYSSDTGSGLSACWDHISPQLLIINLTLSDRFEDIAIKEGHLSPRLLKEELVQFQHRKGYLPPVVTIHTNPQLEMEIREEVAQVAKEIGAIITLGCEGMRLTV
jgi:phosphoribosyl 1,2-cyclic phosphodiesterase